MKRVFADAGYWIALFNTDDVLHEKATAITHALRGATFITSHVVLTEFLNHFASKGAFYRRKAVLSVLTLQQDPNVVILPQTTAIFETAVELYANRPDKRWGFSDCTSFIIMQDEGITEALAHDAHFQQAGFVALLRNEERT